LRDSLENIFYQKIMNKQELIKIYLKKGLKKSHIEMVLSHFLFLDKTQIFLLEEILEDKINIIKIALNRVLWWEPIEYVLNKAEFYSREFYVDNQVLIPRNETELMTQKALENFNEEKNYDTYIDIWTGSGAMPISIFLENNNEQLNAFAVDISPKAIKVAKKNIEDYKVNIKIHTSDLFNYFLDNIYLLDETKKLIITANLPYIKNRDFINMDQEVIFFEPSVALYWWEKTWFELYEELTNQIIELKSELNLEKLTVFYEIWFDQYEISREFLKKKDLKFDYFKDFNNIYRTIKIEFI